MSNCYWLWYPGDFELYHALRQNFSRVERGFGWPAFWKSEGFRNRVVFWREYELARAAAFRVFAKGVGFVRVNGEKHLFGEPISCGPGKVTVVIHVGRIDAPPCVYIEGDAIRSDGGWWAEDYDRPPVPAGYNRYYTEPGQDPAVWVYHERVYLPVKTECLNEGVLYEFETELTAALQVGCRGERLSGMTVFCGESREEALDLRHCYYSWQPDPQTGRCPRCAVRYAFIPGPAVELTAIHQFVDFPARAKFTCDDPRINRIWAVAEHTFRLCSDVFFLDGVKRDRWIWSGDAYQSLFVSRYLLGDPDIEQRTLLALRGNDPMTTHINTIVDYSLLWVLGVKAHYDTYRDREFLARIYPKMKTLMAFCEGRREEHGFLIGKERDWIFIDWADLDKDGPLGAEQMLLAACWEAMGQVSLLLGNREDSRAYRAKGQQLLALINRFYWDEDLGAYLDSFTSGRRHVSRQTNILALRCGVADEGKRRRILRSVLLSDRLPPITTPYFRFYELDALGDCGCLATVLETIRDYWGGMLDRGAVTFWETFDPGEPPSRQYDMYGDKFGKSLCHAWSASPIYLLARYFVGLRLGEPGGSRFVLCPRPEFFSRLDCTLPLGGEDGWVRVQWGARELTVETNRPGGVLRLGDRELPLAPGEPLRVKV